MRLFYGFDNLDFERPAVVSIGSFDGVHSGHRELVDRVKRMAQRLDALSVIISFEPHPRIAMGRAEGMGLLTTVEERAMLFERLGIDVMVVARFDERFREQSYEEFVRCSLVRKLGMCGMVVGYNHRLGRGNGGDYNSLLPLSRELGFELECVEQFLLSGDKVSSTEVRRLFDEHRMDDACILLGHRYVVHGYVREGVLSVDNEHKLMPPSGEYDAHVVGYGDTRVRVEGRKIYVNRDINDCVFIEF